MSAMFGIFTWNLADIFTHIILAINQTYEKLIQWPTDDEFNQYQQQLANRIHPTFHGAICVVDGTEIRISRPVSNKKQHSVYSVKKKQHSVNVLIISLLNGKIIYVSPLKHGSCDQAQWNELQLWNQFLHKPYGILGDGGFTFNHKTDEEKINGWKPHRRKQGNPLTNEE